MRLLRAGAALVFGASLVLVWADPASASNSQPFFLDGQNGSMLADGESLTFSVSEHASADTIVGNVYVQDSDHDMVQIVVGASTEANRAFNWDNFGGKTLRIVVSGRLNYEAKSSYTLPVTILDYKDSAGNADSAVDDTVEVTINVTDEDDPGRLSVSGASQVDATLQARVTDQDLTSAEAVSWQWSRGNLPGGAFADIAGATSASYTVTDDDDAKHLRVTAGYDDGHGSTKSLTLTTARVGTLASNVMLSPKSSTERPPSAQGFTTGSSPDGYDVTSVGIHVHRDSVTDPVLVRLHAATADSGPGAALAEMSGPAAIQPNAVNTFSTPAGQRVRLEADTAYFVVVDTPEGSSRAKLTELEVGDAEDAGKSPGWGIHEDAWSFAFGGPDNTGRWSKRGHRLAIHVGGVPRSGSGNSEPAFGQSSVSLPVDENAESGTVVGTVAAAADSDGDVVFYSVAARSPSAEHQTGFDEFNEAFAYDPETSQITVRESAVLDFENGTTEFLVTVQATDGLDASGYTEPIDARTVDDTIEVTVRVENVDEPGTVSFDGTPELDVEITAELSDPDGSVTSEQWTWARADTDDGPFSAISGAAGASYTPGVGDVGKVLRATVTYHDASSATVQRQAHAVTEPVSGSTEPQFVEGTATYSIEENSPGGTPIGTPEVLLRNSADQNRLAFTVTGADAAAFDTDGPLSLDASTGAIAVNDASSAAALDFETKQTYTVTLEVTNGVDDNGDPDTTADSTIDVTINVTNVDEQNPDGFVRFINASAFLLLVGHQEEPDGLMGNPTWQWCKSASADGPFYEIGDPATTNTVLRRPTSDDHGTYLRVVATYNDGHGEGKKAYADYMVPGTGGTVDTTADRCDDGTVTEQVNSAPEFDAATATATVNENATSGMLGTFLAADPDGDAVTYTVTGADAAAFDDGATFEWDTTTGAVTVRAAAAIDYETKTSYSVMLNVSDGKNPAGDPDPAVDDTLVLTIEVVNVDEPGTVDFDVAPTQGVPLTASLTDPDGSVTAEQWTWARADNPAGPFAAIPGATSAAYTPAAGDLRKVLRATVAYHDASSATIQRQAHAVTAAVSGSAPPEFGQASATVTVDENATSGVLGTFLAVDPDGDDVAHTVTGADAAAFDAGGSFSFDASTGAVTVRATAAIDYETKNSYSVTLNASDGKNPAGEADPTADDTLVLTIEVVNVDEPGTVTFDVAPTLDVQLTAELTDPDGSVTAEQWTWARADNPAGPFAAIPGATSAAYTPAAGDLRKVLRATVAYHDASSATIQRQAHAVTAAVSGSLPPEFGQASATVTVDENATSGVLRTFLATDSDGDDLVYTVTGADTAAFDAGATFEWDTTTGAVTVRATAVIDYETKSSYSVTLNVSDGKNSAGEADPAVDDTLALTVDVVNVDEPGVVDFDVAPTLDVQLTAMLADPDGSVTAEQWSWARADDAAGPFTAIAGADAAAYTPVAGDLRKVLRATVAYHDASSATIQRQAHAVTAAVSGSVPPEFGQASATVSVDENAVSGLLGTFLATDSDGDALVYTVTGADAAAFDVGATFEWDTTTGAVMVRDTAAIDYETKTSYSVVLNVSDGKNSAGEADPAVDDTLALTVDVVNVDEPGVVDFDVAPALDVMLTASLTDPDGGVTAEQWSWARADDAAGPFTVIAGADAAAYTPVAGDLRKVLRATVAYHDASSATIQRQAHAVTVPVSGSVPPEFGQASATVSVDENAVSGLLGTFLATDSDGDALVYTVTGADAAAFDVGATFEWDTTTGAVTVRDTAAIDYETKTSYSVVLNVSDGKNSAGEADPAVDDTLALTVDVVNVDEPGVVDFDVAPALDVMLTASLTDPDGGVTAEQWSWARADDAAGPFAPITGANAAAYTPGADDLHKVLRATVTYNDASSDTIQRQAHAVTAPVSGSIEPEYAEATVTFSVEENSAGGADVGTPTVLVRNVADQSRLTFAVTGTDAAAFGANGPFSFDASTGAITVADSATATGLDYETKTTYSMTFSVTNGVDDHGNAQDPPIVDDTIDVTIEVVNVDEPGVVVFDVVPVADVVITATLTDPDGAVTAAQWSWASADTAAGPFTEIVGADAAAYTPGVDEVRKVLRATVTYRDASSATDEREAHAVTSSEVGGSVPPEFASATETVTVEENTASGTLGTFLAADPDGDDVTYTVTGDDAAAFDVGATFEWDTTTGDITVRDTAGIDYETKSSYSVVLNASDNKNLAGEPDPAVDDMLALTIEVVNVDEPGVVTFDVAPVGDVVITATLTDPDGAVTAAQWSWASADTAAGPFTEIVGADAAAYTPGVDDLRKVLRATVTYRDASSATDEREAHAVTSATVSGSAPPVFEVAAVTVRVEENATSGTLGSYLAADPEGDDVTYTVTGDDAAAFDVGATFEWDTTTGDITVRDTAGIDYETKSSYSVVLNASDNKNLAGEPDPAVDDMLALTIEVVNVDEQHPDGFVLLTFESDVLSVEHRSDPDGLVGEPTWQWCKSAAEAGPFHEVGAAETASTTSHTIDDTDRGMYLRVVATYEDGLDSGKKAYADELVPGSGGMIDTNAAMCDDGSGADVEPVNGAPAFAAAAATVTVEENATSGMLGAFLATDPDGDDVTYTVTGDDAAAFDVGAAFEWDTTTGDITVRDTAEIDYETKRSYFVHLNVSDNKSPSGEADAVVDDMLALSIEVVDVDEPVTVVHPVPPTPVRPPSGGGSRSGGGGNGGGGGGDSGGGGGGDFDVGVATLVVANGWSPADVGVASVMAARIDNAVVAYTEGDNLSTETAELARETQPAKVVIVGGIAAVTRTVRTRIGTMSPGSDISRVTGNDRADTAARAAREVLGNPTRVGPVTLVVANGWSPPDIGAAAALAASSRRAAVLYTHPRVLPEATAAVLRDYDVSEVVVIGGTAAISEATADEIVAVAGDEAEFSRLTGADRIDTAAAAAREVLGEPAGAASGITLVVANGWSPSDIGVAAAFAAATDNAAVAYTAGETLSETTAGLLRDYRPSGIVIIGGAAAVSDDTRAALREAAPDQSIVRRITGSTRTHTAAQAARRILSPGTRRTVV